MKRAVLAWLAVVIPVWLVLVLCTHWEPIMRDGWGHFIRHRNNDLSWAVLWDFAEGTYVHNNPRLGQVLTFLMYTPGPWHSLITPLVELGLCYLLATLALGRWPSLRRVDDALLFVTIVAMLFVMVRSLGPMLFYRPYTGNYVASLLINLLWLVPYRLHAESPFSRRWSLVAPMLVLGFASGLCNEHTGPTFIVAGLFAIAVYWRRGERCVPWAWSGLVGMIGGTVALYLAPGQEIRYNGLASQQSTFERVMDRGVHGNGTILGLLVAYLTPLLVWLLLAAIAKVRKQSEPQPRSRSVAQLVGVVLAFMIVGTLLASPKLGDRLYFASICLACAAVAGWVLPRLGSLERRIAAVLAVAIISVVSWRLVTTYRQASREFTHRMALIETAAPGSTVKVPPYSQQRSRYILGDDFATEAVRANLAYFYQLTAIELDRAASNPAADER